MVIKINQVLDLNAGEKNKIKKTPTTLFLRHVIRCQYKRCEVFMQIAVMVEVLPNVLRDNIIQQDSNGKSYKAIARGKDLKHS